MPNLTSVVKYFPTAQENFVTTTSQAVTSGANIVKLTSVAGYTNGDVVCLVVDPGNANKQVLTGTMDTTGSQVTGVVWTEGTNVAHGLGATVVDYVTATDMAMNTKGILKHANQDGSLIKAAVQAALGITGDSTVGWTPTGYTPNTITYLGNHSYSLLFNGADLTSFLTPGMRLRTTRNTAAPTQSTVLNGTNQYWIKTSPAGMTFTDDFTISAWVKLSSYQAGNIASRYNGTSGFQLLIDGIGRVEFVGYNGAGTNYSEIKSYQSLPLNKWVHVTAQLDMSAYTNTTTTSYIMVDGVDVPGILARAGTNPTAIVQAGNLQIGTEAAGGNYFAGKLAQVAIFSAKVPQATMQNYISQGLTGSEPNLVSAYSFNGNANDLNVTFANNLTSTNGPTALNADGPFGGQADGTISSTLDYGIVHRVTYSTNTTVIVQTPEGCSIPTTGTITSLVYSLSKVPYGFVAQREKWRIRNIYKNNFGLGGAAAANVWLGLGARQINVPIGEWDIAYRSTPYYYRAGTSGGFKGTLSTSTTTETDIDLTMLEYSEGASGNVDARITAGREKAVSAPSTITYYLLCAAAYATVNDIGWDDTQAAGAIWLENLYV